MLARPATADRSWPVPAPSPVSEDDLAYPEDELRRSLTYSHGAGNTSTPGPPLVTPSRRQRDQTPSSSDGKIATPDIARRPRQNRTFLQSYSLSDSS